MPTEERNETSEESNETSEESFRSYVDILFYSLRRLEYVSLHFFQHLKKQPLGRRLFASVGEEPHSAASNCWAIQ